MGFRGGRYPASLGENDRDRIVDYFSTTTFEPPLVTDVRIDASYGRRGWSGFLNRCKGTIGAESGARELRLEMPIDDAEAVSSWRARLWPAHRYLPRPVKTALRRSANRLAAPVSDTPRAASTTHATPSSVVTGKCISSRHFDAIGTETCQILFPGRYNDLLEADRHYLCLDRDFSNVDDVLARFRDVPSRLRMVRDAREWALESQTYVHRVRSLLRVLGAG